MQHAGAAKIHKKNFLDFEADTHTIASPEDGASGSGVAMTQPTDVGAHDASKIPYFASFFPLGGKRWNTEWKFKSSDYAHTSHTALKKRWYGITDLGCTSLGCDIPDLDSYPFSVADSELFLQNFDST